MMITRAKQFYYFGVCLLSYLILYAVLDTDTLLENDMVTLDEALRTSNNAVLMAMNAISILLSVS